MKIKMGLFVLIISTLILTACGSPSSSSSSGSEITNIVWQWTSLVDRSTINETTTNVPDPASYTITFKTDGTLEGKADCNTFSGTYSQENGFSITVGAITQAFCGETSMDKQYLHMLSIVAAGGPDGKGGFALETAGGAQRMTFQNGGPAK